jgi:iron complex outermembrane receptor protein
MIRFTSVLILRNLLRAHGAPVVAWLVAVAAPAAAQTGDSMQPTPPLRFQVPTITVTAHKEPEDKQKLPVSVTAVSSATIENARIQAVSEAAIDAPNTFFTEFTARKLSNARFRGIGSSPSNPGVTTYIDAVPQLNTNSSSLELLDVDQIEFVRGPQSALFGRNTLGGLVNVTSTRPSMTAWTANASLPFGNFGSWAVRGRASGPLVADKLSLGLSFAQVSRDGFTVNDVTGNDLDARSAFSVKGQLLWTPSQLWETRVIVTGERARDGDYALNDLAALRERPFHAARDFEGHTDRNIFGTTIQARRAGSRVVLSSTTGFVNWTTQDVTDLDYTPAPLVVRDNSEEDFQFTQEIRLASAANAPLRVSDRASLKWQSGLFLFTQRYSQSAVNTVAPFLVSQLIPFAVEQHSPEAELDDVGLGVFGQGTLTLNDRLDLTGGIRADYESKTADLRTFFDPQIGPPTSLDAEEGFGNVSPQVAAAYHVRPDAMAYGTLAGGFKAGGFNPAAPGGFEGFSEERTWHLEGGFKTAWADGRVSTNIAAFYIDWDDLQLNVPNPFVPAQFYIANVGDATSKGLELEVDARPSENLDVFAALGVTNARFADGSTLGDAAIDGNTIPNTPEYTANVGLQYSRSLNQAATVYGRADVTFIGEFQYDDANTEGQEAYSLTNLRFGVRGPRLFVEAWVRNAFDERYIPIALQYPLFAPSGFIGEMGAPRSFGLSAGVGF